MAVTEVKTKFKARDGRAFDTREEAESHDWVVEARDAYNAAVKKLGLALASSFKTADGEPFEVGRWKNYLYIVDRFGSQPYLREVPTLYGFSEFVFHEYHGETLSIEFRGLDEETYRVRIDEMYSSRKAADAALLVRMELWLAEQVEQVEALRARVG